MFNYNDLSNLFARIRGIYGFKQEKILNNKNFVNHKSKAYIVILSVYCVDTFDDFNILKKFYLSDKKN